eukprot:gene40557-49750_t
MRSPAECAERLAAAQAAPQLDESGDVALTMARGLWDYVVAARTPGVALERAARVWVDKLTPLDRAQWAYHGVWSYDFAARLPLVGQSTLLLQPAEAIMAQSIAAAALFPNGQVVGLPEFDRDLFDLPEAIARMSAEMRPNLVKTSDADLVVPDITHSVVDPAFIAREVARRYDLPGPINAFLLYRGINDVYMLQGPTE